MKLWVKILIGMFVGLVIGALVGERAVPLRHVGQIFLNMIGMLIGPLIFSSMVVGITSIKDPKKLGRVGLKTVSLYVVTTVVAIVIGLSFALLLKPGLNVNFSAATPVKAISDETGISHMLLNIIPSNAFEAFTTGNVFQVIVFAVFIGLAIQAAKEKGEPFRVFLESVSEVMYSLTNIVMKFAPIGVCAIMASISGTFGVSVLVALAKLLGTIYLAFAMHFFLVFSILLLVFARLSPIPFFKGLIEAIIFAFSTSSSSATVPVTMHCVHQNLGVSKRIASFVIPLGSTINMNGTAIFQGIAALFVAQHYGIDLSLMQMVIIVATATLSAIGAAGIPGAGFVILSIVLKSVGLPLEGLSIILVIDRLRDMVGTVVNIVGDAVVSVYVAKTEGELDLKQYYSGKNVAIESTTSV